MLKFKKSGKGLLVSTPTYKEFGSHPSHPYNKKKLNKLVFDKNLDAPENWGCRENHHFKFWREIHPKRHSWYLLTWKQKMQKPQTDRNTYNFYEFLVVEYEPAY